MRPAGARRATRALTAPTTTVGAARHAATTAALGEQRAAWGDLPDLDVAAIVYADAAARCAVTSITWTSRWRGAPSASRTSEAISSSHTRAPSARTKR